MMDVPGFTCAWSSHPTYRDGTDEADWRLEKSEPCEHSKIRVLFLCDSCKRQYLNTRRFVCGQCGKVSYLADFLLAFGPL